MEDKYSQSRKRETGMISVQIYTFLCMQNWSLKIHPIAFQNNAIILILWRTKGNSSLRLSIALSFKRIIYMIKEVIYLEISNRDLLQVETISMHQHTNPKHYQLVDSSFDIPFIGTRHQSMTNFMFMSIILLSLDTDEMCWLCKSNIN